MNLGRIKISAVIIKDLFHTLTILKNRNPNSVVLMEAHRLEKCMCLNQKGRGLDRAIDLIQYINENMKKLDDFSLGTTISTLKAFVEYKNKNEADNPKTISLVDLFEKNFSNIEYTENGGVFMADKVEFDNDYINRLFLSRHSAREFLDKPVLIEDIRRAVALATTAPSACNRQPSKVYCLTKDNFVDIGIVDETHTPVHLFVTADKTAYDVNEYMDWIVSGSIFTAFLSLALHSMGIGSCIHRKELFGSSKYIKTVRRECKIPENELIICELFAGYYKNQYIAPVSNRKSVDDILYIKK